MSNLNYLVMKKVLLSSVALATAAVSFAAVNVDKLAVPVTVNPTALSVSEKAELVAMEPQQLASVKSLSAVSGVAYASEETADAPIPEYRLPGGIFYRSGYISPSYPNSSWNASGMRLIGSPYSQYTWVNTSINATVENKFTWTYIDSEATDKAGAATFLTANTVNYVSTPENAFLTFNTKTGAAYSTYAPTLKVEGSDSIYADGAIIQYGWDTYSDQLTAGGVKTEGFQPAYTFNILDYVNADFSHADVTRFDDAAEKVYQTMAKVPGSMVGYGIVVPEPEAQYGLQGVTFKCIVNAACTNDVKVNVYKMVDAKIDELLGSGKIAAADVPVNPGYWCTCYVPLVIEDPDLGDVSTTININSAIMILIEANGNKDLALGVPFTANERSKGSSYYVSKDGDAYNYFNISQFSFKDKTHIHNLAIGMEVTMSWMNEVNNDYEFKAPVAGGSKQFDIDCLWRLDAEASMADIYGEGMDEWYTVDMTNKNVMTVTVKALPAGTAGRSSDLVVYTPGAERTFKITQGEVTGIDEIGADSADVLSVEYYDLQGRKLNAEPENGIFIQKNLLSNGKTVATKVAK